MPEAAALTEEAGLLLRCLRSFQLDSPLDRLATGRPEAAGRGVTNSAIRVVTEVLIAHAEGAAMNVAGLEHITGASHGSVVRRLRALERLGMLALSEQGRSVLVAPSPLLVARFNGWAADFVARNRALLRRVAADGGGGPPPPRRG